MDDLPTVIGGMFVGILVVGAVAVAYLVGRATERRRHARLADLDEQISQLRLGLPARPALHSAPPSLPTQLMGRSVQQVRRVRAKLRSRSMWSVFK